MQHTCWISILTSKAEGEISSPAHKPIPSIEHNYAHSTFGIGMMNFLYHFRQRCITRCSLFQLISTNTSLWVVEILQFFKDKQQPSYCARKRRTSRLITSPAYAPTETILIRPLHNREPHQYHQRAKPNRASLGRYMALPPIIVCQIGILSA